MITPKMKLLPVLIMLAFSGAASATTYTDNFQGASANLSWVLGTPASGTNVACLTAGSGSGSIPACTSNKNTVGNGALRLTPASNNQFGNIVSNFTFPSSDGLQVTFTTYTYGGSGGVNGADGISFFLMDGSVSPNIGAIGGSLGYSCSNVNNNANGLMGAYLGLGIDEYGNFLNSGDNTSTGIINSNNAAYTGGTTYGTNSFTGSKYFQPQRIGLRGAGNTSWPWLNANYPNVFPSSTGSSARNTAVENVCKTGQFTNPVPMTFPSGTNLSSITYSWLRSNYSSYYPKASNINSTQQGQAVTYAQNNQIWDFTTPSSPVQATTNQTVTLPNYAAIPGGYRLLPTGTLIANTGTSSRANAWPITYKLIITPAGYLSFSYSYNNGVFQPVLANQLITASNGALPTNFAFGFSGSTGGANNVHDITCFTAQPIQSSSSAAANTIQSGQVQTGTQIYLAYYNANNWWGGLTANNLVSSGGTVTAASVANWDASCTLTGGACSSTGATSTTLLTPANRKLLTWDGSAGAAFQAGSLSSIQTGVLNANTTGSTATDLVDWLRGVRTNEQGLGSGTGALRLRTSVLGDIVNSSPVWVGAPSSGYPDQFNDSIYGSSTPENATSALAYSAYASAYSTANPSGQANRTNVVYSGSNDGFLHGFRSGSSNTNGSYNSTNNDGQEVLGFMPYGVLANIAGASPASINSLINPTYSHNYFVDATPGTGDLFYNGTWHTWLVGGLGSGGKEIYALDITDPTQFTEANATSLVMGDWTADSTSEQAAITCTNASSCNANLGNTNGTPLIRRLHNGKWAIIFGNGLNSSTGHAGVYIGLVNSTTGTNPPTFTYYWLDTGTGSTSSPDGINSVTSADLDGDKVVDYLYGGDLQGNVWRFDLTSSDPADWGASKYGNTTPTPLFTAINGSSVVQPITTQLSAAWTTVAGQKQAMVMFGTGQKIQATATSPDTYATSTQSVYGIWDWDMAAWNNGTTTTAGVTIPAAGTTYRALTAPQTVSRTDLQSQTATTLSTTPPSGSPVMGYRTTSANAVCWQGSGACTASNNKYGWYLDLPASQEQVIYNPIFNNGALVLNTTIPPGASSTSSCTASTTTGWTMAFNVATGGSFPQNYFQNSSGVFTVGSGGSSISGIQLSGVGAPGLVSVGSQQYTYFQTSSGQPAVAATNPQSGTVASRVMWEQLR